MVTHNKTYKAPQRIHHTLKHTDGCNAYDKLLKDMKHTKSCKHTPEQIKPI